MFGTKKEVEVIKENKENNDGIDAYKLQVENERLKIQLETLQFKLDQSNEKYNIIEKQLRDMKSADVEKTLKKIKEENASLEKELSDLKFKMENDVKSIELETENKKLKSQVDIQKTENAHLKELLDTYRAMPDIRNMIDSLSSLAVPHMDELKEFAKMLSDSKVSQLCDELSKTNKEMKRTQEEYHWLYDNMRRDNRRNGFY